MITYLDMNAFSSLRLWLHEKQSEEGGKKTELCPSILLE
jgi:hypothetical protein